MIAFLLKQLFGDSFQRANEDPLDPIHWASYFATPDHPVIANNECEITVDNNQQDGGATWIQSLPTDHWISVQLNHLHGEVNLYARCLFENTASPTVGLSSGNESIPCYRLIASGPFSSEPSIPNVTGLRVDQVNATGDGIDHVWLTNAPYSFKIGDVLKLAVIGDHASGHLYVFVNDVLLYTFALADSPVFLNNPHVGFQLASFAGFGILSPDPPQSPTDVGILNFKAGSASIFQPKVTFTPQQLNYVLGLVNQASQENGDQSLARSTVAAIQSAVS